MMPEWGMLGTLGSSAGGAFLGVFLGWLTLKNQLDALRVEINSKVSRAELNGLKSILDEVVREQTCIARTQGLLNATTEHMDGVDDKLGARIDALATRMDNATNRFNRLDDKLDKVIGLLMSPAEKQK